MAVPVQVREKVSFHRDAYTSLIKGLVRQKNTGEFCDVVLRLSGRCYFAHRAVLAAASPYFRSMFTSNMKEQQSSEVDLTESLMVDNDSFKQILQFMYSGDVDITVDNAEDMLRIADFLLLEELKEYCRQFFIQYGNLNLSNCLCISVLAEHHNLPDVARIAKSMVQSRFHDYLLDSNDILELPEPIFATLIQDPVNTQHSSGDAIVKGILRWISHDVCDRAPSLCRLLSYIPLQSLTLDSMELLLEQNFVLHDSDLFTKMHVFQKTLLADGACSLPLSDPHGNDDDNNTECCQLVPEDKYEPVILGVTSNTLMKYLRVLVYFIQREEWLILPINGDYIMKSVPARLTLCSGILHENSLYLYLSYNLPYPTDMLRLSFLIIDTDTGDHKVVNFRHRYNASECCQTTLTDDRAVPPAIAYCNDCLCVIGNMEGTGQVYVLDPTSHTYLCYQIPSTRSISLARVVVRDNRYLFIWCRHRFGHEEYCINKEVTFIMFDVKNKTFEYTDVLAPPGIAYGEFGDPHILCVEDGAILVHAPGKSSLVLDEVHKQWITYSKRLPAYARQRTPIEMPYHGFEVYCHCNKDVYIFQNPAAYTTSMLCLKEDLTGGLHLKPPPIDSLSLILPGQMATSFLNSLLPCDHFDDSYTRLLRHRGNILDYDTEESGTVHSGGSDSEDYEYDGFEYDDDIYGYYEDFEY